MHRSFIKVNKTAVIY